MYVFQLNAEGLERHALVLMDGTTVIDKQTKITPDGAAPSIRPASTPTPGDLLGGGRPGIARRISAACNAITSAPVITCLPAAGRHDQRGLARHRHDVEHRVRLRDTASSENGLSNFLPPAIPDRRHIHQDRRRRTPACGRQ